MGLDPEDTLISDVADDAIADLVRDFVRDLPNRGSAIAEAARVSDWEQLGRLVHQLKGAAGSYGFGPITTAARNVEVVASDRTSRTELDQRIGVLMALCRRARAA